VSDFVLNLIGLGLSIPFSLFSWWVVARVWRYRGTNISDVMPHAGFSDADKLGYARGALSATTMLTLLPFMFAGAVLEDFLASRGVDWDFMPVLGVMIGGIMLTAVLTFLTKHFYWPRMLIPPAFRERPHERQ
jgi:hypothetical protein